MRILIIEDQENLAKLVKSGLEAEGFAVDCVFDGEAGLKRISMNHGDYDLVLLDWMLPKMNGDEICREVRKKNIGVPILMLTARDGAKDVIAGLGCGADDYLTKPFSFDVLVARIRAILRRPKSVLPLDLKCGEITLNPATKKVFREKKKSNSLSRNSPFWNICCETAEPQSLAIKFFQTSGILLSTLSQMSSTSTSRICARKSATKKPKSSKLSGEWGTE